MDTVKTKSIKGTWCDNADGETWNVKMAESQVRSVMQFAKALSDKNLEDLTRNVIMKKLFPSIRLSHQPCDKRKVCILRILVGRRQQGIHHRRA